MKELNNSLRPLYKKNFLLNAEGLGLSCSGPVINTIIWSSYISNNYNFDIMLPTDYKDLLNYPILPFKK